MQPKVALITGCSSGIGRATAEAFLDEEWIVYATARNPADVERLGERENCRIATLDVTDDGDVDRVVSRVVDEEGHVDCLVNNAGYAQLGPVEDVPTERVHAQFDVNVYGPHRLARAVLPYMRERERGTIVNLSSVAGRISLPGGGVYAGSKFALEAMSDALRAEVDEYGIEVVLIEPGPVSTGFQRRAARELDGVERTGAYRAIYKLLEDREALGDESPMAIQPERVASDVVNAAMSTKPAARYQSGTVARVGVLWRFVPDGLRDSVTGFARRVLG